MPPRGSVEPGSPLRGFAGRSSGELTPEALLDWIQLAVHRFEEADKQQFLDGLAGILDFHLNGGAIGNGMSGDNNGNAGTYARNDTDWNGPGGVGGDGARDRQVRHPAQDSRSSFSARHSIPVSGFAERFPNAMRIKVMG